VDPWHDTLDHDKVHHGPGENHGKYDNVDGCRTMTVGRYSRKDQGGNDCVTTVGANKCTSAAS